LWISVNTSKPVGVIRMVCSNCADNLLSTVRAVQPSDLSIKVDARPWLIMGSIVNIMPGFIFGPFVATRGMVNLWDLRETANLPVTAKLIHHAVPFCFGVTADYKTDVTKIISRLYLLNA
jgi:hypothetical protein